MLPALYDVDDLAATYAIDPELLRIWLRQGDLVGFKLGRRWKVHEADWAAFVDERRAAALAHDPADPDGDDDGHPPSPPVTANPERAPRRPAARARTSQAAP